MSTTSKAPSGVGQSGDVASSSTNLTRSCTDAVWLALMPSPVRQTSGSSSTVDERPGVASVKTYEKAPCATIRNRALSAREAERRRDRARRAGLG